MITQEHSKVGFGRRWVRLIFCFILAASLALFSLFSYSQDGVFIKSYLENKKIVFRIVNNQSYSVALNQVPWRPEHQPYFVACRKPDLLHCVNASKPLSTVWPYSIEVNPGESVEGKLYINRLFSEISEGISSGKYLVAWYFESEYGNFSGVVQSGKDEIN